jgi:hypothetical protein
MTISIHMQTAFKNYDVFKNEMDTIINNNPEINKCLYSRSTAEEFAEEYFKDTKIVCEKAKLSNYKIQNLYKMVEHSDLSIFFFREDVITGLQLTKKSISRARNLEKDFIIIDYALEEE